MENKVNYKLENIKIYDIPGFFINERIRRVLVLYNIITLEDLFYAVENTNLVNSIASSPMFFREIFASINLLRCKYLREELNISINDNIETTEIINALGLSLETEYELIRMNRDKQFYKRLSKMHLEEKILYFRKNSNMTETSINEIAYKLQIIDDYNNYKRNNSSKINDVAPGKTPKLHHKPKRKGNIESKEERITRLKNTINLLPRARGK